MSSNFDWSQFEEVGADKNPDSFDWSQFEEVKKQPSKTRSVLSAPIKGLIKGLREFEPQSPFTPFSRRNMPFEEEAIEKVLPTREGGVEEVLERAGKLAPLVATGPEGWLAKLLQLGGGVAGGELAKHSGSGEFGESIGEVAGLGIPGLLRKGGQKVASLFRGSPDKLESGLTKLNVLNAKKPSLGTITKERQKEAINKLTEESKKLAETSLEKHAPITKQIREGVDLEKGFEKDFGQLKQLADRANPYIEIEPVENFLFKQAEKYHGIPNLHPEGAKVQKEVGKFLTRPQNMLSNLLKVYRSNNQKQKTIFETSRLTGKQQEYSDFLSDFNRKISESIARALPEDSKWMRMFKDTNRKFAQYKNGRQVLKLLEPIVGEKPSLAGIRKLASNPSAQKRLEISMGRQGAQEISQIAKDMEKSALAIKNIPKKEWNKWDLVSPLSFFVPIVGHSLGTAVSLAKAGSLVRHGYGMLLTTPSRRKAYSEVLKAISEGNLSAYRKVVLKIDKELEKEVSN